MGQYRQWLHYRDVDRHLHAQREKLTQEIAHLREQVQRIEAVHPDVGNSIFQALIQQRTTLPVQLPASHPVQQPASPVQQSVSSDPFPDTSAQRNDMKGHNPQTPHDYASFPPLPPLPHQNEAQPEEILTSLDARDARDLTDPQLTIPRWLQRAASTSQSGPLDAQSAQTNRLVQRWLERWGKQLPPDSNQKQTDNTPYDTSRPSNSVIHEDRD